MKHLRSGLTLHNKHARIFKSHVSCFSFTHELSKVEIPLHSLNLGEQYEE